MTTSRRTSTARSKLGANNACRYYPPVIRSFRDRRTRRLHERERIRGWPEELQRAALRKLLILDAAADLRDLRSPPGNRLEKLSGDRAGEYSIRINEQWRVCFRWSGGDAYDVQIADYH
jgi:toxin HigB-1